MIPTNQSSKKVWWFSIIIPSYNEGEDIRLSIESAIAQNHQNKEILVVDDSTDNTPEIIKEYEDKDVQYIRGEKKGCCGARNLGMRIANGDIVVLLNADVVLPVDFLDKILKHYENSADYILVESEVFNRKSVWSRFIEMQHRFEYKHRTDIEWTEGFSCRREAALAVGGIPGEFNLTFCRDWLLGVNLNKAGCKKIVDKSILVKHKAPETFKEYWKVRKARGRFGALNQYFLPPHLLKTKNSNNTMCDKINNYFNSNHLLKLSRCGGKFFIKSILFLLKFLLVVPVFLRVYKISQFSERKLKDFFPFYLAYFIQELARVLGEWQGFGVSANRSKREYRE